MSLATADTAHLLGTLALLLVMAHAFGYAFRRLRQPQVIGEILGGLVLGPTVLGAVAPDWHQALFVGSEATTTVLSAVYQVGLLLLMFCSGMELRSLFQQSERKLSLIITLTGTLLPLLFSIAAAGFWNPAAHMGAANNETAFLLVFAIGVAVTSIPVISRILFDLKLLDTPLARIALSAAVIEDVLLYAILSVALSLVDSRQAGGFGLLGVPGGTAMAWVAHLIFTALFFLLSLTLGPALLRWAEAYRFNLLKKSSPAAFLLLFLMAMTGLAIFMGIAPMLGALVAGLVASHSREDQQGPRESVKTFSFAFFIPIYFAIVGLRLDLLHDFDLAFFVAFLVLASAVKILSVFAGGRWGGESGMGALNLAIVMNARGGPGIVLASVAFDAAIINGEFYAALVLLSVVTSLGAGSWLNFVLRKNWPLR